MKILLNNKNNINIILNIKISNGVINWEVGVEILYLENIALLFYYNLRYSLLTLINTF